MAVIKENPEIVKLLLTNVKLDVNDTSKIYKIILLNPVLEFQFKMTFIIKLFNKVSSFFLIEQHYILLLKMKTSRLSNFY